MSHLPVPPHGQLRSSFSSQDLPANPPAASPPNNNNNNNNNNAQTRSNSLPDFSADSTHDPASAVSIQEDCDDLFPVPPPAFQVRKPSDVGLSLQTDIQNPSAPSATSQAPTASNGLPKPRPAPLEPTRPPLSHRTSWGTPGGSPSSTASSPALAALGDVTPLPSPIGLTHSPDIWKKVAGRPHSNSAASIERDRAAGFLNPAASASSPGKKKTFPNLNNGAPPAAQDTLKSHDHKRSISEFVPDPLYNIRPRTVTGPSVVTPAPEPFAADLAKTPLHREAYLARDRGSVDLTRQDARSTLPSPPPSNVGTSDEELDSTRRGSTKFPPLLVHDQISGHAIAWQPLRILGTGSFSEVFLASSDQPLPESQAALDPPSTQRLVAIKIVAHASVRDAERMDTSIKREIELLRQISHPCLPQLYAVEDGDVRALLVMNYCAGGDLFELASQNRLVLRPRLIQRIFAELVGAVAYLHRNLIVHRDIKLENVLLNLSLAYLRDLPTDPTTFPQPVVTLTDLGLSKHIPAPPSSPLLTHACGSVDYAAPELLLQQPYDGRATDAWALGVLLYALMEGRLPFDPLPEYSTNVDGSISSGSVHGPRRRRARGSGSSAKHRIARCDWLWCEYGDEDGDWLTGSAQTQTGTELDGARECVEGLLKKVGRGRWSLEDKVLNSPWVREGIRVEGGLRVTSMPQRG